MNQILLLIFSNLEKFPARLMTFEEHTFKPFGPYKTHLYKLKYTKHYLNKLQAIIICNQKQQFSISVETLFILIGITMIDG